MSLKIFALATTSAIALVFATASSQAAESAQKFPSAKDALAALMESVATGDINQTIGILGESSHDLLIGDDPTVDAQRRAEVLADYRSAWDIEITGDMAWVRLGYREWPLPIPLKKVGNAWIFDIEAGRQEIDFRRIGRNELGTIALLHDLRDVQNEFRRFDHDGDGVMEFANSILSDWDTKNGLYWSGEMGPIGARLARADLDGYFDGEQNVSAKPYQGYYFRILTAQGDNAVGGAYDYKRDGNMIAGHAILAVPSDYGHTGVHSFIMAENGVIYEADLGDDSLAIAQTIKVFDPDERWSETDVSLN